jgi:hypothetical protein
MNGIPMLMSIPSRNLKIFGFSFCSELRLFGSIYFSFHDHLKSPAARPEIAPIFQESVNSHPGVYDNIKSLSILMSFDSGLIYNLFAH